MSEPSDEDPVLNAQIEAEVERASALYEGILPADVLDEMRQMHRIALRTHPVAQGLLRQMRPDPVVGRSEKVDIRVFKGASKRKKGTGSGG